MGLGSITKSLTGGGKAAQPQAMKEAQLQPYSYTSLIGNTSGEKGKDGAYNFSTELTPQLQSLYAQGQRQAEPFLSQYLSELQSPVSRFDYQYGDPRQREQEIFNQQAALLQPAFNQQNINARDTMFGTGRMGLSLAGGAVGAGAGTGLMNPDMYANNLAQSRALAELAPEARRLREQEQQAEFKRQESRFILGSGADQQRLENLLGGYGASYGTLKDVFGLEQELLGNRARLEQIRSDAMIGSAQAGRNLFAPSSSGGGFLGSLFSSAGAGIGDLAGDYVKDFFKKPDLSLEGLAGSALQSQTGYNPNSFMSNPYDGGNL
jgi:hypothetical protein